MLAQAAGWRLSMPQELKGVMIAVLSWLKGVAAGAPAAQHGLCEDAVQSRRRARAKARLTVRRVCEDHACSCALLMPRPITAGQEVEACWGGHLACPAGGRLAERRDADIGHRMSHRPYAGGAPPRRRPAAVASRLYARTNPMKPSLGAALYLSPLPGHVVHRDRKAGAALHNGGGSCGRVADRHEVDRNVIVGQCERPAQGGCFKGAHRRGGQIQSDRL